MQMWLWRSEIMESIRSIQWRTAATQTITLGSILSMALIIWRILILITACESPVVVVLTGSMEPGFRRGDVLFLNMKASPIQSGEIVVFKIEGKEIPIVHRVITAHRRHNASEINLLTKGDSNYLDDSWGIYADGQEWLEQHHVMGRVMGYLPYVGWATIVMTEKPLIKYLLIGGLSLLAITSS
uniref:Signal peptidase complex catalytic subunit SEC11 n=1 Tax=Opuntia streptacantha TaxID=393608 RepID=A0A7C8ZZ15_OPUST